MTTAIEASGLGKRYGRRVALADCTLAVPAGRVTGLVGPNGAGKTTLLQLAAGLLDPTSGEIRVLDEHLGGTPAQLARVGFVAQDAPVYGGLSVAGHLRMGAWLNQGWDAQFAERRISRLGRSLAHWVREARESGLDDESIESLLRVTLRADSAADSEEEIA